MKKKLRLKEIKVTSFVTSDGPNVTGGLVTGLLTCAGGFTCENIAGCGGVYTHWGNENLCGNSGACPQ